MKWFLVVIHTLCWFFAFVKSSDWIRFADSRVLFSFSDYCKSKNRIARQSLSVLELRRNFMFSVCVSRLLISVFVFRFDSWYVFLLFCFVIGVSAYSVQQCFLLYLFLIKFFLPYFCIDWWCDSLCLHRFWRSFVFKNCNHAPTLIAFSSVFLAFGFIVLCLLVINAHMTSSSTCSKMSGGNSCESWWFHAGGFFTNLCCCHFMYCIGT